jgi:UTP--glucose-1-phosphate uridylyltransferase
VAILVLNGGMATRFGGGAKGVVSVVESQPRANFLAVKLGQVRMAAHALGTHIPVVLMHSFATQGPSEAHLREIDWPARDGSGKLEVVQFERLIGQITESVPSAYLEVDCAARFCPIKVREDLRTEADALRAFARDAGVV